MDPIQLDESVEPDIYNMETFEMREDMIPVIGKAWVDIMRSQDSSGLLKATLYWKTLDN